MLTPATTAPHHITVEEHSALTSSTPADFSSIPPVLRWSSENVAVEVGGEGWYEGKVNGQLWVTEDSVTFLPSSQTSPAHGFTLAFPALTLHALTPASADGSVPAHVYCQVDETQHTANGNGNGEVEDDGEDWQMREVRIYVDAAEVERLFNALSDCSALHASLLPNGQASSFPFFDGDDDDDDVDEQDANGADGMWEDADEDAQGHGQEDGAGGRETSAKRQRTDSSDGRPIVLQDSAAGDGQEEDLVDKFANMVDWGNVPKPAGW